MKIKCPYLGERVPFSTRRVSGRKVGVLDIAVNPYNGGRGDNQLQMCDHLNGYVMIRCSVNKLPVRKSADFIRRILCFEC